jgi:Kdo2-lipid IVA lauroyltransferase/acyltransferase
MLTLFRLLARLPLSVLHTLGAAGGWLVYWASPGYRARLRANLAAAIPISNSDDAKALLHTAIAEAGKSAFETPAIWFKSPEEIAKLVEMPAGWDRIEALLAKRRGILFLTPHLGCFEVTAQYYAQRHPITVLYRPPRKTLLEPLMLAGRTRANLTPVPANLRGVRAVLKALKRGEAVGILPDQVPRAGEGAWADFFGRPAYTMTLAARLVKSTRAPVVMAYAERLPQGKGYRLVLQEPAKPREGESFESAMNHALENLIRRCPGQYLWAYNRYKKPRGEPGVSVDTMRGSQ